MTHEQSVKVELPDLQVKEIISQTKNKQTKMKEQCKIDNVAEMREKRNRERRGNHLLGTCAISAIYNYFVSIREYIFFLCVIPLRSRSLKRRFYGLFDIAHIAIAHRDHMWTTDIVIFVNQF